VEKQCHFIKDVAITYVNFIKTKITFSEKSRRHYLGTELTCWQRNWMVERRVRVKVAGRALSHSGHYAWEYRFWCISSNTWRFMSLPPNWSCDHQTWLPCAQSALYFLRNSTTWRLHNLWRKSGHRLFLANGSAVLFWASVLLSVLFNGAVNW
jgi:hypothetical protein